VDAVTTQNGALIAAVPGRDREPVADEAAATEWVRRHAAGDRRAFDELYRRFSDMVFRLASRLAGDRDEALDISQEVFLRVHRHLASFRGHSSLRTWIYRITLNQSRTAWSRRPRRQVVAEERRGLELVRDPSRGADEMAMARESADRVRRALRGLPKVFREPVILRDLEELAYEEIASVLDLPIGTVRSRIARGRERLRQALETESC
jgi:RNA polymerase sigma-70 factor (ECF subfamily)